MSTSITGVNNEDRSNETYLHEVNDDEEETANVVAEQNHDKMEPDEMYETMNTNNIYESKESAEDIFENDEHEESTVDTFENDEHEENAEGTFENNKHAEDEANNNDTFESSDEQKNNDDKDNEIIETIRKRGGRIIKAPSRFGFNNLQAKLKECSTEDTRILIHIMQCMERKLQFVQRYTLKKSMKKFGNRARQAATSELLQLHKRMVFKPVHRKDITKEEMDRSMESLIFFTEKRDEMMKARACADGSVQREYVLRDKAASPTVISESVFITSVIDAKQNRDVMTCDIPNALSETGN